jgi:hypothetical protein
MALNESSDCGDMCSADLGTNFTSGVSASIGGLGRTVKLREACIQLALLSVGF